MESVKLDKWFFFKTGKTRAFKDTTKSDALSFYHQLLQLTIVNVAWTSACLTFACP